MKKDKVFYQSKFEHYRVMNMWIVIASCISSLFYVISDWYLFGEINMVTVPARTAILIPFAIFMIVNAKVKDYRVIVPLSYLIAHSIMWSLSGRVYICRILLLPVMVLSLLWQFLSFLDLQHRGSGVLFLRV